MKKEPTCLITIKLRHAFKQTIKHISPERRLNRMIGFNLGMLRQLKNIEWTK